MNRTLRLLPFFVLLAVTSSAQRPFLTRDSININNINAALLVHGDMWWKPDSPGYAPKCEFPAGSGKHLSIASSVWMAGHDEVGQLHLSAQTYRQRGCDYWPGPLNDTGTIGYTTAGTWAKIWKLNRSTIDSFRAMSSHTTTNTPDAILTWPAKGNIYARGNASAALSIIRDLAPFVDVNGNGVYEPLAGDYPAIRGDQALWEVFNDKGPNGFETQLMAFAYRGTGLINNIVFYQYTITNRTPHSYHHLRLSKWMDADLGFYNDDYIGFDSAHRMGVVYNGYYADGASAGFPPNSYDSMLPVEGVTVIVSPEDAGGAVAPAGAFTYYNNDASVIGSPTGPNDYNDLMRAISRRSGLPQLGSSSSPGCFQYDSVGVPVPYAYPGDPSDTSGWSECRCMDNPGDRRFILSTGDFTMAPGQTVTWVYALLATDLARSNGCPTVNFNGIREVADTAWSVYHHPPTGVAAPTLLQQHTNLFPNPATGTVTLSLPGGGKVTTTGLEVYNTLGQLQLVNSTPQGDKLVVDVNNWAPGVYTMRYTTAAGSFTARLLKQ
ncbi:MAG: T9SS C-terminal target domain-containing protein [Chitinophagia bacterium]|nr:T9SS C-terminal target domain-containing protein [Chitinophagia bacterium]